jgi:hypothetical protein
MKLKSVTTLLPLLLIILFSCEKNPAIDYSTLFNFYLPLHVGSSWRYHVNHRVGDSYAFFYQGIEEWEVLEVSDDRTIIKLQTIFNGSRTSRGFTTFPNPISYENEKVVLTLTIVEGNLVRVKRDGDKDTLSFLDVLLQETKSGVSDELCVYQPLTRSGKIYIEGIHNNHHEFSYKLNTAKGIEKIRYRERVVDWTIDINFELIEFHPGVIL